MDGDHTKPVTIPTISGLYRPTGLLFKIKLMYYDAGDDAGDHDNGNDDDGDDDDDGTLPPPPPLPPLPMTTMIMMVVEVVMMIMTQNTIALIITIYVTVMNGVK